MKKIVSNPDFLPHLRMLTMKQVCALTGYSRTHIYRLEAAGDFPRRVKLGPNSIRFYSGEIEAWMLARPRAALPATLCEIAGIEPAPASP